MRGVGFIILLLIVCSTMLVGEGIRDEKGTDYDIKNATSQIEWEIEANLTNASTTEVMAFKWADAMGFTVVEISKWGMEFGFNHPEYDFDFTVDFFLNILWILVILACIPALPIIFAVIYLIYLGIKKLVIKINDKYSFRRTARRIAK